MTALQLLILRWLPIAALAMLAVGIALHVGGSTTGRWLVQLSTVAICLLFAVAARGRLKRKFVLDEREVVLFGHALSGGFLAVANGALLLIVAGLTGLWAPSTPTDWGILMSAWTVLLVGGILLQTGRAVRPIDDEDL